MRFAIVGATLIVLHGAAQAAPTAEELFNAGQLAYDHGNYALAVDRWEASYRLSIEPALLYNIAQAYRLAGNCKRALLTYTQFVAVAPTSERRPLADELVRELEGKCGQLPVPKPTQVPDLVENRRSGPNPKLAGLVTGGAGTVLVVTGLLFGRRARMLGDEVTRDCAVTCDWAVEKAKERDGKRYVAVGKVLDVVGVAAIATGIGLYVYGVRKDEPALTIQPQPAGATVSWCGRW